MIPIGHYLSKNCYKSSTCFRKYRPSLLSHSQRVNNSRLAENENEQNFYRSPDNVSIVPKIGLEVHAQLKLDSKLFSQGSNSPNILTNSQLDLFDISLPGTLPKLNKNALQAAILTGLALNCSIQETIHFDRKNYFYSDMPAGFQLTQYYRPIAKDGFIEFITSTHHKSVAAHSQRYDLIKHLYADNRSSAEEFVPYIRRSRIKQIQLEQDSAKSLHSGGLDESQAAKYSLVDYNRSGAALIEIVFEPDLSNHHEASSLVKELILILKTIGTCDCQMAEGSLRVDANVSIQRIDGKDVDSTGRVELKNLNSIRSLNYGIAHEVHRQANILRNGGQVAQESRVFGTKSRESVVLREKENAVDYRYVPEPSIPPIHIENSFVDNMKAKMPTLMPKDIRNSLLNDYKLDMILAVDLMNRPGLYDYIRRVMDGREFDANTVADFLIYSIENLSHIEQAQTTVDLSYGSEFLQRLTVEKTQTIFDLMFRDRINFMTAYEVMKIIFVSDSESEPEKIIEDLNLYQINDEESVRKLCRDLIKQMKNIPKKYSKKGDKRHMRAMLDKLCELTNNRICIRKSMEVLDDLLRKPQEHSEEETGSV